MTTQKPYQRSAWCGQGWTLRGYRWKGELFAALYMGTRCHLGVLKFGSEGQLLELAQAMQANVTMVSDAREPGEIHTVDLPVPHLIPEVKGTGWGKDDDSRLPPPGSHLWDDESQNNVE